MSLNHQSLLDKDPKNKQLFFLIGYPRSGNTLLASILNQNPNIACSGNSITLEMAARLYLLKQDITFKNFPDHQSYDNVLNSIFDLYYSDWPQKIIIDRGPVTTPGNMEMMKKHFGTNFKCIVLLRDLKEVLASYIKWFTNQPDAFVNKEAGNTLEDKLHYLMKPAGAIYKQGLAIQNSYLYKDICHYIKYDDLVTNTENILKKLYEFLNINWFEHNLKDLKQLNINGITYDDTVIGNNMHTIRTEIKKEYNNYINQIPKSILTKYEI